MSGVTREAGYHTDFKMSTVKLRRDLYFVGLEATKAERGSLTDVGRISDVYILMMRPCNVLLLRKTVTMFYLPVADSLKQ